MAGLLIVQEISLSRIEDTYLLDHLSFHLNLLLIYKFPSSIWGKCYNCYMFILYFFISTFIPTLTDGYKARAENMFSLIKFVAMQPK